MDSNLNDMLRKLEKKTNEINENYNEIKDLFEKINNHLANQSTANEKLRAMMQNSSFSSSSDIVRFNIGGKVYATYKSTIAKQIKNPNSENEFYGPNLLEGLASGLASVRLDDLNAIFIDRNNYYFDYVLDFLRNANSNYEFKLPTSKETLAEIEKEADFYKVEGLKDLINTPFLDSTILSKDQKKQLMKLCDFPRNQKFTLLYRASLDGFSAANFHTKCDKSAKTLTIIKANSSHLFGAYTEATWNSTGSWITGNNSFLFSLINSDGTPLVMNCIEPNHAIYCNINYGPTFGNGHSLYIANNSNANRQSYTNLGTSYKHPKYLFGSNEAKSFLAGSYNFQVDEIEVYRKES